MSLLAARQDIVDEYVKQLPWTTTQLTRLPLPSSLQSRFFRHVTLGNIGSHSALDVSHGAVTEGLHSAVVVQEDRAAPYTDVFDTYEWMGEIQGVVDETKIVQKWKDMLSEPVVRWLRERHAIVIPNRSLAVYLRDKATGYQNIYDMRVPFFGNIELLQAEERDPHYRPAVNQLDLAKKAGLAIPEVFSSPEKADKPFIIKADKGKGPRSFARNFLIVRDPKNYHAELEKKVNEFPEEDREAVRHALTNGHVEEFIDGPYINFYFFNSPLRQRLEFVGTDTRQQFPNGEEAVHIPNSPRESLLSQVYKMGKALVEVVAAHYERGAIGPVAVQCVGDENEILRMYDMCLRIGGAPDTEVTPLSRYSYRTGMSYGRRIARETKDGIRLGKLDRVLT